MKVRNCVLILCAISAPVSAQVSARSTSTFAYHEKDGEKTVEITNAAYQVTQVYEPRQSWFVLRTTTRSKEVLDEKGWESQVTLEAWPMGADVNQRPLYALELKGSEATLLGGALWQVLDEATDPDVPVWSVYQVATGNRLFESFVAPLSLRVATDRAHQLFEDRYAGLYVPPDDAPDARLRDRHVVAVLSYASGGGVLREALLTCDDVTRAANLRSYADTERTLSFIESPAAVQIRFKPGPAVRIPVFDKDFDWSHAVVPSGLHLNPWKR
jgi:hypothetical protein